MRLSIKGTALASGLLWGGAILIVGLVNLARPTYGTNFITMMTSLYPWFHSSHTIANLAIGTIDGVIDGAVGGCLFGFLYNTVLDLTGHSHTLQERHP